VSNLIKFAKKEFEILGWPGDDEIQKAVCDDIIELLRVFSEQGHSGTSAPYVLNLFNELAKFHPISPLTGEEDEWVDHGDFYQNKRCFDVFKDKKTGEAYWSSGIIFKDSEGSYFTSKESRVPISFPWMRPEKPKIIEVD